MTKNEPRKGSRLGFQCQQNVSMNAASAIVIIECNFNSFYGRKLHTSSRYCLRNCRYKCNCTVPGPYGSLREEICVSPRDITMSLD